MLKKIVLDSDAQPYKSFCFKRNKEKAILSLRGILQGVIADNELNEQEVLFLNLWLNTEKFLKIDSPILFDAINEILVDREITQNHLTKIRSLIEEALDQ